MKKHRRFVCANARRRHGDAVMASVRADRVHVPGDRLEERTAKRQLRSAGATLEWSNSPDAGVSTSALSGSFSTRFLPNFENETTLRSLRVL